MAEAPLSLEAHAEKLARLHQAFTAFVPHNKALGLVFEDFESGSEFASVWGGDIVGSVQSPLLCDLPTG